jgi:hypothetical protein
MRGISLWFSFLAMSLSGFDVTVINWPHSQAPVAHACNPSYSGDRDQEDHGSKPAYHKKGLVEWLKV